MKKEEVERIFERAKYELLALVCAEPTPQPTADEPLPEWFTEEQLAEYWQLESTAGIQLWRKRSLDQFPLPHGKAGDKVRYNRKECDQWLRDEATRQRLAKTPEGKSRRHSLSIAPPPQGA